MSDERRVVLAGGSGLVGLRLAAELGAAGFEVVILSRSDRSGRELPAGVRLARWDGRTPEGWWPLVDGAAAVVNLSGENVGDGRWTPQRKALLATSRLEPTRAVVAAIELAPAKPEVLLQASAVGFYGARGDQPIDESAGAGRGFLPELSIAWESASAPVEAQGVRRVLLRTGIVLAREGGALPKMLPIFRLGLGGPLGSGRQGFSWIHAADVSGAIRFLLGRADLDGPFNLTAPGPVDNETFSRGLAEVLGRPCFARVPGAVLRLAVGEMAEVLLSGQFVLPSRLVAAGFEFRQPQLEGALADLVGARVR